MSWSSRMLSSSRWYLRHCKAPCRFDLTPEVDRIAPSTGICSVQERCRRFCMFVSGLVLVLLSCSHIYAPSPSRRLTSPLSHVCVFSRCHTFASTHTMYAPIYTTRSLRMSHHSTPALWACLCIYVYFSRALDFLLFVCFDGGGSTPQYAVFPSL